MHLYQTVDLTTEIKLRFQVSPGIVDRATKNCIFFRLHLLYQRSVKGWNGRLEKKQFSRPCLTDLYMGDVNVLDQRAVAHARGQSGIIKCFSIWLKYVYLHTKSQNHASLRALQFWKELASALVQDKCFRRDRFRANPCFYSWHKIQSVSFPLPCEQRYKINLQGPHHVQFVHGVRMCPEPCRFQRYHTMQDYNYDDY